MSERKSMAFEALGRETDRSGAPLDKVSRIRSYLAKVVAVRLLLARVGIRERRLSIAVEFASGRRKISK